MAGEIRHLAAVEDRELDGLFGAGFELEARVVELAYEVDRREVGAAELCQPAAEREPRADPTDQTGVGHCAAYVGDRGLRQPEPASQLTRPSSDPAVLCEQVEDRGRA